MTKRARNLRFLFVVLALLLLGLGVWKLMQSNKKASTQNTESVVMVKRSEKTTTPTVTQKPAPAKHHQAPDPTQNAETIYTQQKSLAEQGHAQAQCYLGIRMTQCHQASVLETKKQALEAEASSVIEGSKQEKKMINRLLGLEQRIKKLNQQCGNFKQRSPDAQQAWSYLLQAAQNGSVNATLHLVTQPPLNTEQPLRDLQQWQAYKEQVPQLIEQAIAQGSIDALMIGIDIWNGYGSLPNGGEAFEEKDLVRAVAYAQTALTLEQNEQRKKLLTGLINGWKNELTNEQIIRADAWSHALISGAFSKSPKAHGSSFSEVSLNAEQCYEED